MLIMEKIGKKFNLKKFNNYKVSYGTVDSTLNQSIYLNLSTWVQPITSDFDAKKLISSLTKTIKQSVYENIQNTHFNGNYIIDVDIRESGFRFGKSSFMSCNITLFTNVPVVDIEDSVSTISDKIIKRMNDKFLNTLSFKKTKK
jgi:hypothetical protein